MFGTTTIIVQAVAYAKAYKEEARRFDAFLKTLPEDRANEIKAERKMKLEENLKHQRALEVAREGRPLNFWGNR